MREGGVGSSPRDRDATLRALLAAALQSDDDHPGPEEDSSEDDVQFNME